MARRFAAARALSRYFRNALPSPGSTMPAASSSRSTARLGCALPLFRPGAALAPLAPPLGFAPRGLRFFAGASSRRLRCSAAHRSLLSVSLRVTCTQRQRFMWLFPRAALTHHADGSSWNSVSMRCACAASTGCAVRCEPPKQRSPEATACVLAAQLRLLHRRRTSCGSAGTSFAAATSVSQAPAASGAARLERTAAAGASAAPGGSPTKQRL